MFHMFRPWCLSNTAVLLFAVGYASPLATQIPAHAKQTLEASDGRFVDVMERLQKALNEAIDLVPEDISASNFSSEREVLLQLDRVLEQLIKQSEPVLAIEHEYLALGDLYEKELKESGPISINFMTFSSSKRSAGRAL